MARPEIEISAKQVEQLASLGAKTTEIADFFGCSVDTIDRRFAEELTKGRSNMRMSLRRWQLKAAEKGNATMLVWLGKQMLGQVDKLINELSGIDGNPIRSLAEFPDEQLDEKIKQYLVKQAPEGLE